MHFKEIALKSKTYYRTGGACALFAVPQSVEELAAELASLHQCQMPYFLLGAGTNSLVSDDPWPGAVISFEALKRLEFSDTRLVVGAGVENTQVAAECLARGIKGAEFMHRLPGQVGATVRMNARCYGGEMSRIVTQVTTVSPTGTVTEWKSSDAFRGYKDTVFMTNGHVVAEAALQLERGEPDRISAAMKVCEDDRNAKGHFLFPSCGCVFKNDYTVGVSSGILLDAAGVKGMKRGGAEVSHLHANFVYNKGATAREILELTFQMRQKVYEVFGVWLEYEMEVLGNFSSDLTAGLKEKKPPKWNEGTLAPLRTKTQERQKFVWG